MKVATDTDSAGRASASPPLPVVGPGGRDAGGAPVTVPPCSAIEMCDVWVRYGKSAPALQQVCLNVRQGERHAIVGPSGSGKSTLLKVLKGLVPAERGTVATLGTPVNGKRARRQLRARIGYIPQNLGLVSSATVLQNALMGCLHRVGEVRSWLGLFPEVEYRAAHEALEATGISHLSDRLAHQLSGGERRRLAISRALVQRPEVLLADEFLSELDDVTAEQILRGLDKAHRELGMTVLMVEHDLQVARTFCDRVTVLREGCKVCEVNGSDIDDARLRDLFRGVAAA